MGELGITPRILYEEFTFRSLMNAVRGNYQKEERAMQLSWDQVRFQTFHLFNIQLAGKDKLKNYTDLVKFPWDKEPEHRKLTSADLKQWIRSK